jgi:pantetheine-phosphate adenylyltransferase
MTIATATQRRRKTGARERDEKLAVYPGSFDPITNGHLDILERALRLFDRVIVTLAVNPRKQPLFTVAERIVFIQGALPAHQDRLDFASFDGLLVDFVKSKGATTVVRGLRALADFEYEFQFAHMNRRLAPSVDTMFFMTDERNHYVSSSLVKEVASLGGDVTGLVPAAVVTALNAKYGRSSPSRPAPSRPRSRRPNSR